MRKFGSVPSNKTPSRHPDMRRSSASNAVSAPFETSIATPHYPSNKLPLSCDLEIPETVLDFTKEHSPALTVTTNTASGAAARVIDD